MATYRRQTGATPSEALQALHQFSAKLGPRFRLIGVSTLDGRINRSLELGVTSQEFDSMQALWAYARIKIVAPNRALLWCVPLSKAPGRAAVLLDSQLLDKGFNRFDRRNGAGL